MNELLQISSSSVVVSIITGLVIVLLLFGFIIYFVFSFRNKQKGYVLLQNQKAQIDAQNEQLEKANTDLKATQAQLIQSEKMASLGELTAGIAHEIQNPLNFINNFSEINQELIDEVLENLAQVTNPETQQNLREIKDNSAKIMQHGSRVDAIVKGMLQHSRKSTGQKDATDINALCDEFLRLSYHGLRAKDKSFKANYKTDFDPSLPKINVVPQEIGRVILNLINNAFYTVNEKGKEDIPGYMPIVMVATKKEDKKVIISIQDNGKGIPEKLKGKVFQPFFTTKPTGQGTGLGLSLSYDIVKMHGGEIQVKSKEEEGTEIRIVLPM